MVTARLVLVKGSSKTEISDPQFSYIARQKLRNPLGPEPEQHSGKTVHVVPWRNANRALVLGQSWLNIANTIALIISTDYAVLFPTADIDLSLITTLPAYDATLFASQLLQGNIINDRISDRADGGLATVAAMTEFITIASAVVSNIRDIASLIP